VRAPAAALAAAPAAAAANATTAVAAVNLPSPSAPYIGWMQKQPWYQQNKPRNATNVWQAAYASVRKRASNFPVYNASKVSSGVLKVKHQTTHNKKLTNTLRCMLILLSHFAGVSYLSTRICLSAASSRTTGSATFGPTLRR
jgi:hypothetical protein